MPTHWIECCLCSEVFKLKEKYEKNLKKQTISKSSGFGFDIKFWRYIIVYSSHDLCYGD